jgi:hypothetical protein
MQNCLRPVIGCIDADLYTLSTIVRRDTHDITQCYTYHMSLFLHVSFFRMARAQFSKYWGSDTRTTLPKRSSFGRKSHTDIWITPFPEQNACSLLEGICGIEKKLTFRARLFLKDFHIFFNNMSREMHCTAGWVRRRFEPLLSPIEWQIDK